MKKPLLTIDENDEVMIRIIAEIASSCDFYRSKRQH